MEPKKDILADIDGTLDQLIENAKVIREIGNKPLFECETEALQKTQESLLARLLHRETLLELRKGNQVAPTPERESSIQEKFAKFSKLNSKLLSHFTPGKKLRIPRTRKRVLSPKK